MEYSPLHRAVLHLPVISTLCCIFFASQLFSRSLKHGGPHLLWWGIGMVTYGMGTFTEAYTTLIGWNETVFRFWYVAGAFLDGYPLAQLILIYIGYRLNIAGPVLAPAPRSVALAE